MRERVSEKEGEGVREREREIKREGEKSERRKRSVNICHVKQHRMALRANRHINMMK